MHLQLAEVHISVTIFDTADKHLSWPAERGPAELRDCQGGTGMGSADAGHPNWRS